MQYKGNQHTFAVCAYKESPFLEECLVSLKNQSVKSNIIIVTSTPNDFILKIADKYRIKVFIKNKKSNIAQDWNFAYKVSQTELVTITHQDDIYEKNYLLKILENVNKEKKPLIAFTNYCELRETKKIFSNLLLKVKTIMLFLFRIRPLHRSVFVRRRILSFGSPICCPSVTYIKPNLPDVIFKEGYRSDVDWQAWEMISKIGGSFVYCKDNLVCHRIHDQSATTKIIADNDRTKEDFEMFCCFWPKWFAKILIRFYENSQKSNQAHGK